MTFEKSEQKILTALLSQNNQTKTQLTESSGLSYHCMRTYAEALKQKGLVSVTKKGRESFVRLTGEGRRVAKFFSGN